MLTIIIGVVAFVAIMAAFSDGEIGSAVLGIVIVVVLMLMASGDRKDTKAMLNFRDYWAEGGPDRRRR